jgi:hypothetical protein
MQDEAIETGWLIERGGLCLGTSCLKPAWVTFTDPAAIRFSREQDAENMLTSLQFFGEDSKAFHDCRVSGHQWG